MNVLFFVQMGIYLFIDYPLRNLIAISLSLLGIKVLIKKDSLLHINFVLYYS